MRNALLIAWREFAENAKTRGFWFGILLFPVIWIVGAQVPSFLARRGTPTRHYVLVDRADGLSSVIRSRLDQDEAKRTEEAFRDWATTHLLPGKTLPSWGAPFDLGVALDRVKPLLRTNAGTFRTPEPRFREVPPPGGVELEGDVARLETDLRAWLKDGRTYLPEGGRRPVELFAVAILTGPRGSNAPPTLRFWSSNQADTALRERMDDALSQEFRRREYVRLGIDPGLVSRVERSRAQVVNLSPRKAAGEERVGIADLLRQWVPSAFVYLLWVAVFSIAQMLLNSVIEEKSNRIIEVLLSSVTPLELMAGKLVGIAAVGLVMITAWVSALVLVGFWMAGGAAASGATGAERLPLELMTLLGDSWILPAFALYFLLGYVLYSAVILAIGSTCNTIKEAQNYMGVIVLLMMVPLVAMTFIPRDPNGPIATFLSWIPPYTPFVMMNRVTAGPPLRDVLGTLVLLMAFDGLAIWACGRIFRTAVLRTGQPASIAQMWRWVRGR